MGPEPEWSALHSHRLSPMTFPFEMTIMVSTETGLVGVPSGPRRGQTRREEIQGCPDFRVARGSLAPLQQACRTLWARLKDEPSNANTINIPLDGDHRRPSRNQCRQAQAQNDLSAVLHDEGFIEIVNAGRYDKVQPLRSFSFMRVAVSSGCVT